MRYCYPVPIGSIILAERARAWLHRLGQRGSGAPGGSQGRSRPPTTIHKGDNMKKILAAGAISAATLVFAAGSASADQPDNPGCFGRDRAAWLAANSGAAWGEIAPVRAGDNGGINRAYRDACGG